jgi:hypothetical protein
MKRKSRRAKVQKISPINADLELIEPDAATVDVGSRSHWVAVNPQRDPNPVREFGAFTADLMSLADWLAQCGAKSVVMVRGPIWNGSDPTDLNEDFSDRWACRSSSGFGIFFPPDIQQKVLLHLWILFWMKG